MSNAERCRRFRERHPGRAKEHHARWRDTRRAWLDEKKSNPCKDCGGSFPPECMDFDHTRDKQFDVGQRYARVGIEKLEQEIAKCDLVCANCHRIRTRARGVPWQRSRQQSQPTED